MTYRLLALDLDGTLLRSDQVVDAADVEAITRLQRAGVAVTIITGRLHSGALGAAEACAIEGVIGCCEGSHLVELATSRTHHHHPVSVEMSGLVRGAMGEHQLASFVFDAHGIHHDHAAATFADYIRTWSPNLRVVEEEVAWATQPLAAVGIGDADAVAAAARIVAGQAEQLFSVSFPIGHYPGKHALLVRAKGPTKGTALTELCRLLGISVADAVCVGDWVNDIPMFEVAGRSFAMGEAPEAVRAAATDTLATRAGAGGGIAEAIRRAWG